MGLSECAEEELGEGMVWEEEREEEEEEAIEEVKAKDDEGEEIEEGA